MFTKPATSWRDVLPIHPAAELFPLMSPDELKALGEDIKAHGLTTSSIAIWEKRGDPLMLLDGRNRLDSLEAIGGIEIIVEPCGTKRDPDVRLWYRFDYEPERKLPINIVKVRGDWAADPYAYVISANILRRHLNVEDKDRLIVKLLKVDPTKSNRQIAKLTDTSHPHVAKVRGQAERTGDVETVTTSIDTRGREQHAHKAPPKPKPRPKSKSGYDINPVAEALFTNEDQIVAFAHVVNTKAARKFITFEQQVDLAKHLIEGNIRATNYQAWTTQWLRQAGKAQSEIDDEERDDFYKEFPGYEIKDEVDAAKNATRSLVASLLKLEDLWKKFPAHLFFGDIGSTLDGVVNMIRQYRRASGEKSADETERKLAWLREFEDKARTQEGIIEGLRREVEEAKATTKSARDDIGADSANEAERLRVYVEKLEDEKRLLEMKVAGLEREIEELRTKLATRGDMSISEFLAKHKQWEETVETQRNIIAERDAKIAQLQNENAKLRAQVAAPPDDPRDCGPMPASIVRSAAS